MPLKFGRGTHAAENNVLNVAPECAGIDFFFSSRRRHTRLHGDWSSDVCSSDLDISWVRSLSGYRLGVILPKGYSFLSSNVAAQMSTLPDGRLALRFANPSGLSNPLTVHARKT